MRPTTNVTKPTASPTSSHLAPVCVFSTCSLCAFLGLIVLDLTKTSSHGIVAIVCLSTCVLTAVTDPGIVMPNRNGTRENEIERGEVDGFEAGGSEGLSEECDGNARYCETCKIFKPKKSSHCRTCNVCVRGFDHHCGALNNCIGEKNVLFFVIFIVTEAYLAVTFFWKAYERLSLLGFPFDYHHSLNNNGTTFSVLATLFLMVVCVHGSCMSLFSCFHVVLYVQDLTTKELSDYVKSRGGYRQIVATSSTPSSLSSSSSPYKTACRPDYSLAKRIRKAFDLSGFRLKSQTMMEVNKIRASFALEE